MDNRLITYLESSFLKDLLMQEDVTDISYNGKSFFYMSNKYGRKKADLVIEDIKIMEFLRQVANLSEQQFSYSEPNMDFSVGKYRINAVHNSIGRVKDGKAFTFVIRIGSENNRIEEDKGFIDKKGLELIKKMRTGEGSYPEGITTKRQKALWNNRGDWMMDGENEVSAVSTVFEADRAAEYDAGVNWRDSSSKDAFLFQEELKDRLPGSTEEQIYNLYKLLAQNS